MNWDEQGGGAFPLPPSDHNDVEFGMSLRDWFAGQALSGYFANQHTPHQNATDCAAYIYAMADAMLDARKVTVEK